MVSNSRLLYCRLTLKYDFLNFLTEIEALLRHEDQVEFQIRERSAHPGVFGVSASLARSTWWY